MSRKKIGRNEPCWCGSGRKYKHCHLDRGNQTPLQRWELSKLINQKYGTKTCLAPVAWLSECSAQIAKAHTVPKASSLQRIAREGHVYSLIPRLGGLREDQDLFTPKPLGINHASTFSGFCSRHDDTIFAPLEKQAFSGTPEQCFLLGYRALALELYKKLAAYELNSFPDFDKGKPIEEQVEFQKYLQARKIGLEASIQDLNHYKSKYDKMLEKREFDTIRAYVIELENPPPVMGSGGFDPDQDFEGLKLQDVGDLSKIPDLLYFSSFYSGGHGVIAFSWLQESDPSCCAFIKSLDAIPDELITAALLRCFFEYCENLHIQPDWWEGLPCTTRNALIKRLKTAASPFERRPKGVLKNDGITSDLWTIDRRYKIPINLEL